MSTQHTTPSDDHAPGFRAIRFNMDWIARPLFGIVLGAIALGVVWSGAKSVAIFVGIGFILAAIEWHRCVGEDHFDRIDVAITAASVMLAEAAYLYTERFWTGFAAVAAGAIVSFAWALRKGDKHPFWRTLGGPYLAIPALCLVALSNGRNGALTVSGMLIIVWFTDTGALIFGNLIGGPRLAPKLSPGKTWAGTIGGSIFAALVFTFCVGIIPGSPAFTALLFGFLFSFVAHGGDLLESFIKRRFGVKNSGSIIPGHGGVLDRIDSTLAAAPVMALFIFAAHFNPVFWAHT